MAGQPRRRKAQRNVMRMLGVLHEHGPLTMGQVIAALNLPDEPATRMACRDLLRYPRVTVDTDDRLSYRRPSHGR
jgi:hypothetical protein